MFAVAIDGPAGAGKSTIARTVAEKLGYIYVDTGALYRTVGYYAHVLGVDPKDEPSVLQTLSSAKIRLRHIDGQQRVFLNEKDVSDLIRTPEISMAASAVSAYPAVRKFLFGLQQTIAAENNVVMDGRDIGTVVLPHADVKIFLTASPEERARRRFLELKEKGVSYEEVLRDVKQRDLQDTTRAVSPLRRADNAILLDTTDLNFDESVQAVLNLIHKAG